MDDRLVDPVRQRRPRRGDSGEDERDLAGPVGAAGHDRGPPPVVLDPDREVLALAQPEVDARDVRRAACAAGRREDLVDVRLVDRAALELDALGERERDRRRGHQRDDDRCREHAGQEPAILRRVSALLAAGAALGFVLAAQVGPVTLLIARSVLRGGRAVLVGLAMACAVASVDVLYATLGLAGVGRALTGGTPRLLLGLATAAILAAVGA